MDTALCIIPPDEAWDDIQRARHIACDPSFYNWPPAIRLFHPFIPKSTIMDRALDVANLVELYEIEPFNVTLDHLLILPYLEVIEEMEENSKLLPDQLMEYDDDDGNDGNGDKKSRNKSQVEKQRKGGKRKSKSTTTIIGRKKLTQEEKDVEELIQSEERKGKAKLKKRLAREEERKRLKAMEQPNSSVNGNINDSSKSPKEEEILSHGNNSDSNESSSGGKVPSHNQKSPRQTLEEQQKSKQKFNGPCILCLEPDEESQIHLQTLREILQKKLFNYYDPFSPSSTFSKDGIHKKSPNGYKEDDRSLLPRSILRKHGILEKEEKKNDNRRKKKKQEGSSYRPLISLGQFSTVTKAVDVARRLQQSWEPLTFEVCDLQMISSISSSSKRSGEGTNLDDDDDDGDDGLMSSISSNSYKTIQVDDENYPILPENREYELRKHRGTSSSIPGENLDLSVNGEYGCDAMIMLLGEESQLTESPPDNDDEDEYTDSKNIRGRNQHEGETNGGFHLGKEDEDKILDLLMTKAGTPGGGESENNKSVAGQEQSYMSNAGKSYYIDIEQNDHNNQEYGNELEDISDYVLDWLSEDDDYDEGATVVIGRTQFFMGDMRQYTGMPASSTIDGKDKKFGENVSGSARRRGAVHRQGDRWNDGDFGSKAKDKQP